MMLFRAGRSGGQGRPDFNPGAAQRLGLDGRENGARMDMLGCFQDSDAPVNVQSATEGCS